MAHQTAVRVPFIAANVGKCMCPKCPVQSKSSCVAGKLSTIEAALKANPLKKEDIPGVYCSTGKATCTDINPNASCLCGACGVYDQYKLANFKPGGRFCGNGASA